MKPARDVPVVTASASAASPALGMSSSASSCRRVRVSPASRPATDSPRAVSTGGTAIGSSRPPWASTTAAVISFVMLATGTSVVQPPAASKSRDVAS